MSTKSITSAEPVEPDTPMEPVEPEKPVIKIPLRENALTTLEAVKVFMGIDLEDEDPQRDAALSQLINSASAWLETTLGRKLGRRDYRQRYTATGTQRLVLEQYPIRKITKITDTDNDEEVTGYYWDDDGDIGVVYREDGWTYHGHIGGLARDYIAPRRYLLVEYTAGYILPKDATEEEPSDLPWDIIAIVWGIAEQEFSVLTNGSRSLPTSPPIWRPSSGT